jgi:hypothetical protein
MSDFFFKTSEYIYEWSFHDYTQKALHILSRKEQPGDMLMLEWSDAGCR